MIVTRIAYSQNITASKLAALEEIASRLGRLRSVVWDKYGSLQGVRTNHRAVRDSWLASKRQFDVPARIWKETLRDVFADIELYRAAAPTPNPSREGNGVGAAVYRQHRQKIEAIAKKSNKSKRHRIKLNNLGRNKLDRLSVKHSVKVKTKIYQGTHSVLNKAFEIVCEDLAVPIKAKKNRGKDTNRRLSGWVKGLMADALEQVSPRRGASVVLVNAAYTSQACSCCGSLGDRQGDRFYCTECRVVLHADYVAARNVLARLNDPEISRWTTYQKVKSILLERQRRRLSLCSQDSSCTGQPVSTESELPSSLPNNA